MVNMSWVAIEKLSPNGRNARTHSRKQIRQIADSIHAFGFVVPILIDDDGLIIAGHGRYAAAKMLDLKQVPTIKVEGLSAAKRRALALADNQIAQNAGWDRELLAAELPALKEILAIEGLDLSITGFSPVEVDQLVADFEEDASDPDDAIDPEWAAETAVSKPGDLWQLDKHRILCGDARNGEHVACLMGDARASMMFTDPPYNVRVRDIGGRGRIKHAEFAMASGELSRSDFVSFLKATLAEAAAVSHDGAVHYVCMDWRHIGELIEAGGAIYDEMLNLAVWVKSNAGEGSFYRSQHELVGIFRVGIEAHLNNVELGRHGRSRSNVWHYRAATQSQIHLHLGGISRLCAWSRPAAANYLRKLFRKLGAQARQRLPRSDALTTIRAIVPEDADQPGEGHRIGVRHDAWGQPSGDLVRRDSHGERR